MKLEQNYSLIGDSTIALNGNENYTLDLNGQTLDLNCYSVTIKGNTTGTIAFTNGTIINGQIIMDTPNAEVTNAATSDLSVKWVVNGVKDSSYVLTGKIYGTIIMRLGRLVIEDGAQVGDVRVTGAKGNVNIVIKTGSIIGALIVSNEDINHVMVCGAGQLSPQQFSDNMEIGVNSASEAVFAHGNAANLGEQFSGGTGTKVDPYLVANVDQFNNVYKVIAAENLVHFYFKQIANIDFSRANMDNGTSCRIDSTMTYDGNGNSLFGVGRFTGYSLIFNRLFDSTVKNMKIYYTGLNSGLSYNMFGKCNVTNVSTYGEMTEESSDEWLTPFISYPHNTAFNGTTVVSEVTFKNCVNNTILNGSAEYAAGFVVHGNSVAALYFDNCTNNANICGTNAAGFVGMTSTSKAKCITPCYNKGNISGILNYGAFAPGDKGATSLYASMINSGKMSKITTLTLTTPTKFNADSLVVPAVAGAATYSVTVFYRSQLYNYYVAGASLANVWGGGFSGSDSVNYAAPASGDLVTGFKKLYVGEKNVPMHDYMTGEVVSYEGVYVPAGFRATANRLTQVSGDKEFYYSCNEDGFHGLLTSKQQANDAELFQVSFQVSVFDANGVLIAAGTCGYSYTIAAARAYFAN